MNATNSAGRPPFRKMLEIALLVWIVASAIFFYIRFSFTFVYDNLDAIRGVLGE